MFRLKVALIAIGGFLGFSGFEEMKLSKLAQAEPTEITLGAIEDGEEVTNAHVILSDFGSTQDFIYFTSSDGSTSATPIKESFFPLISLVNYTAKVTGQIEEGAEIESLPPVEDFRVLLKTKRFKTLGEAENADLSTGTLQGLFVNEVDPLSSEELGLLKDSYPNANFDKLLILEEGKKPASSGAFLGRMGGGGALSLLGLGWLVGGFRKKR